MDDSSLPVISVDGTPEDVVSRECLYEQAWSLPMTKIATRYGVSSSYLARIFTDLDIPRPPVGYWAQVAVGRGNARPPLPPAKTGARNAWSRNGAPVRIARPSLVAISKPKGSRAGMHEALPNRHPILRDIEDHFQKAKEGNNGYLRPSKRAMADLVVSRTGASHAIDFANQFYLALLRKRLTVTPSDSSMYLNRHDVDHREQPTNRQTYPGLWQPQRPTVVYIGSVAFGLTIYEVSEHVHVKSVGKGYVRVESVALAKRDSPFRDGWLMSEDMPTGRLCLQVYSPYYRVEWIQRWIEKKPGNLVSKIPGIVKYLMAEASGLAQKVQTEAERRELESQQYELERQERMRRDAEKQRLRVIQDSREQLETVIQTWAKVNSIRAFFDDIERSLQTLGDEEKKIVLERLDKARELIGEMNALQHFEGWEPPPS